MRRDQLELVQNLAERQEKEVGNRLSSAQAQVDATQSQLNQVLAYRRDYHRLATGATGTAVDTHQLQTARHFLSQLDTIVGRQQTTVQQAELLLEQQRVAWVESKRRLNAIKKLRASRAQERSRSEEKVIQRWLDELFALQNITAKAL